LISVYIDGSCEPINPNGIASFGLIVYADGKKLYEQCQVVGEGKGMSNNYAEYCGLCAALKWLIANSLNNKEIIIYSDSQLLVNQMNELWQCHEGFYAPKYHEALRLKTNFSKLHFKWIPREQNKEADALSRKAYEEYCMKKQNH